MSDLIDRPALGLEEEDATNLFMKHIKENVKDAFGPSDQSPKASDTPEPKAPVKPPVKEAEEDPEDTTEPEDAEEPSEDGEDGETEEAEKSYVDDDTKFTKIKVGEEEYEVSVKDLKRLYGQETAINQRSQQFAEDRKKLNEAAVAHVTSTNLLLDAAKKRYEPYAKLDFLALSRDPKIPQNQFAALREEAQHRWEEVNFLENQVGSYMQQLRERQKADMDQMAVASVKDIMDPLSPNHIDGWDQGVYNELRAFAVKSGVPQVQVDSIVEAPVIKLLYDAMLYRKGKEIAATKVTRVGKTPTKVIKSKGSTPKVDGVSGSHQRGDVSKHLGNLRGAASNEDVANAFFASFNLKD